MERHCLVCNKILDATVEIKNVCSVCEARSYIFIGSDTDLTNNGFSLVQDNEIRAIKRGLRKIYISKNDNVFFWEVEDILDLIQKGLIKQKGWQNEKN